MTTEPTSGQYDRTVLPLVAPEHELGPLRRMGRFEWEKVLLRSRFNRSSVKIVGLAAATYSTPGTGANVRPGITRLIAVTGLGDSMVRRNLKALESAGFMFMVTSGSNYGRGGKGAASDYQLTAPELLAEQYEAERNSGAWDETDQWDMELIQEHRYSSTDDPERNTGTFDVSPVLSAVSPVLGAQNTGTGVPPTPPLPHQVTPLHQTSHQSVDRHLSDAREDKTNADDSCPLEVDQQTYTDASDYLQRLPDLGQAHMATISTVTPDAPIMARVIAAAQAAGWTNTERIAS